MVIELRNNELTVQFKEFGGALSSIKDEDGIEYLWQGNPQYRSKVISLVKECRSQYSQSHRNENSILI